VCKRKTTDFFSAEKVNQRDERHGKKIKIKQGITTDECCLSELNFFCAIQMAKHASYVCDYKLGLIARNFVLFCLSAFCRTIY
jgi:hypothetical protein